MFCDFHPCVYTYCSGKKRKAEASKDSGGKKKKIEETEDEKALKVSK